jgi:hypothetical protein
MFMLWSQNYQGTFKNKNTFKTVWSAIPKFICWKLWLARNKVIFNNVWENLAVIAAKAKALLSKHLKTRIKSEDQVLDNVEELWIKQCNLSKDTFPFVIVKQINCP